MGTGVAQLSLTQGEGRPPSVSTDASALRAHGLEVFSNRFWDGVVVAIEPNYLAWAAAPSAYS
jgi:hypothetical protein